MWSVSEARGHGRPRASLFPSCLINLSGKSRRNVRGISSCCTTMAFNNSWFCTFYCEAGIRNVYCFTRWLLLVAFIGKSSNPLKGKWTIIYLDFFLTASVSCFPKVDGQSGQRTKKCNYWYVIKNQLVNGAHTSSNQDHNSWHDAF